MKTRLDETVLREGRWQGARVEQRTGDEWKVKPGFILQQLMRVNGNLADD